MDTDTPITLAAARYSDRDAAVERLRHGLGRPQGRRVRPHRRCRADQGRRRASCRSSATTAPPSTSPGAGRSLGAALTVVAPVVGASMLARAGALGGAGALVGHFHHNIPKEDVEAIGDLLESGQSGLIVVAVNRTGTDIEPLLANAEKTEIVNTTWGDLDAEIDTGDRQGPEEHDRLLQRRPTLAAGPSTGGGRGWIKRSDQGRHSRSRRHQQGAQTHRRTAESVATSAPVAGVGTHAGDRVPRSQRRAGREGVRLVLPARHRRRRVHARGHPLVDPHRRSRPGSASEGTLSTMAREAFASADDVRSATGVLGLVLTHLLRQLLHDRVAAGLSPRVAATRTTRVWRLLAGLDVPAGGPGRARHPRRRSAAPSTAASRVGLFAVVGPRCDVGAVVVHRLVPPARRGAGPGPAAHRP